MVSRYSHFTLLEQIEINRILIGMKWIIIDIDVSLIGINASLIGIILNLIGMKGILICFTLFLPLYSYFYKTKKTSPKGEVCLNKRFSRLSLPFRT